MEAQDAKTLLVTIKDFEKDGNPPKARPAAQQGWHARLLHAECDAHYFAKLACVPRALHGTAVALSLLSLLHGRCTVQKFPSMHVVHHGVRTCRCVSLMCSHHGTWSSSSRLWRRQLMVSMMGYTAFSLSLLANLAHAVSSLQAQRQAGQSTACCSHEHQLTDKHQSAAHTRAISRRLLILRNGI